MEVLYRIMDRLKSIGSKFPGFAMSQDLLDLLDCLSPNGQAAVLPGRESYFQLNRYLHFLEQEGYLALDSGSMGGNYYNIKLTSHGQKFVQPELAEFGRAPMLPQVVNYIENRIDISARPEEEKAGMLVKLRDAMVSGATDVLAKALAEIAGKVMGM